MPVLNWLNKGGTIQTAQSTPYRLLEHDAGLSYGDHLHTFIGGLTMATTNIWQQFKSLIPEGARTVITVQGESVAAGKKALMEGRAIKSEVPDLDSYEAEV